MKNGGVLVLVAILLSTVISCNRDKKKEEPTEKTEMVRHGEFVVKIRETGSLEPRLFVEVKSNVSGQVKQLFVKEGDYVEKDQELLKIDDDKVLQRKKQAEARLESSQASVEQSQLQTFLTGKGRSSDILQYENSLESAKAALASTKATALQQLSSAKTDIESTKNLLEQDRITLSQTKITLQQAELQLDQNKSNEASVKIELDNARAEYDRSKDLYEKKFVSKKSLEDAELRFSRAESAYESAQKNVISQVKSIESQQQNIDARKRAIENRQATLRLIEQNLGTIQTSQEASTKQATANLKNAKIRLQQAIETIEEQTAMSLTAEAQAQSGLIQAETTLQDNMIDLDWTVVKAPLSGRITRMSLEAGDSVMGARGGYSQAPPVLTISDLSKMEVTTRINEAEIGKVALGQQAEIKLESHPDQVFTGQVTEIAPSAPNFGRQGSSGSQGVVTFKVVIEIDDSESELLPGMTADVDIIVFDKKNVLQLPIEAVIVTNIMTANTTVAESDLDLLVSNQLVKVETLVGKKHDATIGKIHRDKDRYNVEILLKGNPSDLRAGPTSIHLVAESKFNLRNLPANLDSERKHFVQLNDPNVPDKPKKKKKKFTFKGKKSKKEELKGVRTRVEVGQRNNTHFQILSGVSEGDLVYVPSLEQLTRNEEDDDK